MSSVQQRAEEWSLGGMGSRHPSPLLRWFSHWHRVKGASAMRGGRAVTSAILIFDLYLINNPIWVTQTQHPSWTTMHHFTNIQQRDVMCNYRVFHNNRLKIPAYWWVWKTSGSLSDFNFRSNNMLLSDGYSERPCISYRSDFCSYWKILAAKRSSTPALMFCLSVWLSVSKLNFSLFGPYLTAYDRFWQLMTAYDSFWQFMTAYDSFWQIMTAFDSFWQLLTAFDSLWQLLTALESIWQLLTTFDNFWQLLKAYESS